jgi:putative ABC transport system substrate-binding protein
MDRRTFINGLCFSAIGTTLAVSAQEAASIPRMAFLREGCPAIVESLVGAMRELGWVGSHNIVFDGRCTDSADRLPALATELVRQNVALIFAGGTGAALAAKAATRDIPIVFFVGLNPIQTGLIDSLPRPGGNLTGFAQGLYDEKQLQVLKAVLPGVSRVAYAALSGVSRSNMVSFEAARTLGVEIQHVAVEDLDDFAAFFAAAKKAGAEAALIPDVPRLTPRLPRIGVEASRSRMPAIGFRRAFAESGGLLSYAPMVSEAYARLAVQVDRILRGARPGDLPVEQPTRFELVINLKEAKALGVSIPRLVRLGADELIQ